MNAQTEENINIAIAAGLFTFSGFSANNALSLFFQQEPRWCASALVMALAFGLALAALHITKKRRMQRECGSNRPVLGQDPSPLNIAVTVQGAPIVNCGNVFRSGDGILAMEIDLRSKYCEVDAYVCSDHPGVSIVASERSYNLEEKVNREEATVIEFPEYPGWTVWMAEVRRYTLAVCLIKRRNSGD